MLQLEYSTVKKLLGETLKYESSDPKNVNPYNTSGQKMFINLTEYTGELSTFENNYDFFLLSSDKEKVISVILLYHIFF
jgi:hypothetical protein